VIETVNDVNRQEDGRLLWTPLRVGDPILLGDKIKTSGLSSTLIEFSESKSKLQIEENSTIKMEGVAKKLSLNMMEGRVFLKQEPTHPQDKMDVISGGKKVDVEGDVAVSVDKAGVSQVDTFKNQGSEVLFQDLKPYYNEEILSAQDRISVSWTPSELVGEVSMEIGESPVLLKRQTASTSLQSGKLEGTFKAGSNYWRLITSQNGEEKKSPLMLLKITRPISPGLIFPAAGEVLNQKEFDFKWSRGNTSQSVKIEVAEDPGFVQMVDSSEVQDQTFFHFTKTQKEGDFFWRIRAELPQGKGWLDSKTQSFKILHGEKLLSPMPIAPADNAVFYFSKSNSKNMKFEWKKQEGVRGYELQIEGSGVSKKLPLIQESAMVNLNKVGTYTWTVTSESQKGVQSAFPIKREFEVRGFHQIAWKMSQKTFFYLDTFPIIILQWDKKERHSHSLKISSQSNMLGAESFQVPGYDFPYRPLRDGFHYAQVQSVDERGEISGESEVFEFKVEKAPLPPIPKLQTKDNKLIASSRGELEAQVENFQTNWTLVARVTSSKGVLADERRFAEAQIKFNGLLPGNYVMELFYLDQYQRKSELSSRTPILVPEKSMIAAPRIKGIKVR
jgi:hypothetical protein